MTFMCEVDAIDFSVPIHSDSESDSDSDSLVLSSYTSDTEYDGEVHIGWDLDDFNRYVDKKHWDSYSRNQFYNVIVQIQDRCRSDAQVVNNLVISHWHILGKKSSLPRFYCESTYDKISGKYFSGIFYNPTSAM